MSISTERRATLTRGVKDEARRLGFEAVAIARADAPLEADYARYEAFIDAGYHGEMAYLADDREVRARLDGPGMLAGAKSVVCLARSYKRSDASDDAGLAASVARYARGQDYHNGLRKKLRKLASFVRGLEEGAEARPLVDDAPRLIIDDRAHNAAFTANGHLAKLRGPCGVFVQMVQSVDGLALMPREAEQEA